MSGFAQVVEGLHAQINKHLGTIRELRAKLADAEEENTKLTTEIEKLRKDNRWLEAKLFEESDE